MFGGDGNAGMAITGIVTVQSVLEKQKRSQVST